MVRMAIKATVVDESGTHHLVIGLNRENMHSIVSGEIFTLRQEPWCSPTRAILSFYLLRPTMK
jgi:hypothetical protein